MSSVDDTLSAGQSNVAVVIAGLLRLSSLNRTIFHRISRDCDIFVCTNRSQSDRLPDLGRVVAVRYVEDNSFDVRLEEECLARRHGRKFLQWQKLYLAMEEVKRKEAETGRAYRAIFKLRTDLDFGQGFALPAVPCPPGVLFMQSDFAFGGSREAFERIHDFIFPALLHYQANFEYQRIDLSHITECDLDCGRFAFLKLPRSIFWFPSSERRVKRMLVERAKEISAIEDGGSSVYCKRRGWDSNRFRSEPMFLHYVLDKGLIAKSLYRRWIPLHPARKSE